MVDILDQDLMTKILKQYLLPFCCGNWIIQKCSCTWTKYDISERKAIYYVDFDEVDTSQHFTEIIYLISPGQKLMTPDMPKTGEIKLCLADSRLKMSYKYIVSLDLLIQVFPTDITLPQLRFLFDPKKMLPYLQAHTALNNLAIDKITTLKYKPEKRCVIKYDIYGKPPQFKNETIIANYNGTVSPAIKESFVGKTYDKDQGDNVYRKMRFLLKAGISVPKPISYIPELKLIIMETLPGRELKSFVNTSNFPLLIGNAARSIAGLHRLPVDQGMAEVVSMEVKRCKFSLEVEWFNNENPSLAKRVVKLSQNIIRELENFDSKTNTYIHGEFDLSQLLVSHNKIWFVDFDKLCISHQATDVGRFLAYLSRLSLRQNGNPCQLAREEEIFLEAYLSLCPDVSKREVFICQAMECLKVFFILYRRRKMKGNLPIETMVDKAESVLTV